MRKLKHSVSRIVGKKNYTTFSTPCCPPLEGVGGGIYPKLLTFLILSLLAVTQIFAQSGNTDNQYQKPLGQVLKEIEKRFGVTIKYSEGQVKDKIVKYADWRFRVDVDQTLDNVLKPLDMKVNKEKDKVYKLKEYEYNRWDVKDGWANLDKIAEQYNDKASWKT